MPPQPSIWSLCLELIFPSIYSEVMHFLNSFFHFSPHNLGLHHDIVPSTPLALSQSIPVPLLIEPWTPKFIHKYTSPQGSKHPYLPWCTQTPHIWDFLACHQIFPYWPLLHSLQCSSNLYATQTSRPNSRSPSSRNRSAIPVHSSSLFLSRFCWVMLRSRANQFVLNCSLTHSFTCLLNKNILSNFHV